MQTRGNCSRDLWQSILQERWSRQLGPALLVCHQTPNGANEGSQPHRGHSPGWAAATLAPSHYSLHLPLNHYGNAAFGNNSALHSIRTPLGAFVQFEISGSQENQNGHSLVFNSARERTKELQVSHCPSKGSEKSS